MSNFWYPLCCDIIERNWGHDAKTENEHIRLWITQRPQTIVVFLKFQTVHKLVTFKLKTNRRNKVHKSELTAPSVLLFLIANYTSRQSTVEQTQFQRQLILRCQVSRFNSDAIKDTERPRYEGADGQTYEDNSKKVLTAVHSDMKYSFIPCDIQDIIEIKFETVCRKSVVTCPAVSHNPKFTA